MIGWWMKVWIFTNYFASMDWIIAWVNMEDIPDWVWVIKTHEYYLVYVWFGEQIRNLYMYTDMHKGRTHICKLSPSKLLKVNMKGRILFHKQTAICICMSWINVWYTWIKIFWLFSGWKSDCYFSLILSIRICRRDKHDYIERKIEND